MDYQRRIIDDTLDEMFPHLAAIALEGAKGVGKTATGTGRAATVLDLSIPQRREAVEVNENYISQVPHPVLIDEWQLVPEVWDQVKRAVDADWTGGHFLLAGSAGVAPGVRIHSGAGRIVSMKMRPLSIAERGITTPTVSLRDLMAGGKPEITGDSPFTVNEYTNEILASGFPGIRRLPPQVRDLQLDSYITRIVEHDLPENGVTVRRPRALRAWLAAYAAATSGTAAYSTILDAATAGEDEKASRVTVDTYREQLTRLFILDPVPAWIPAFNPLKRLGTAPKHHLVDPAIAARLVGVGKAGLLHGDGHRVVSTTGTWLGALFESLVAQSVRVYAEAMHADVGHLRTTDGKYTREIDLIVEGSDRQVVALEVKLAPTIGANDVQHLLWLGEQIGDRLADQVVITTGHTAYRRHDGVAVVPLALLGP